VLMSDVPRREQGAEAPQRRQRKGIGSWLLLKGGGGQADADARWATMSTAMDFLFHHCIAHRSSRTRGQT
jgi:hypothetical protein